MVDVAGDGGDEGLEAGEQLALGRGLDGAEQHLGVAEERLEAVHRRRVGHVDVAEAVLEGAGVGLEAGDVAAEQVVEPAPHVGEPQHGVHRDLLEADPQAQVVGGKAPLPPELVEVGGNDHQLVRRRPRDGQVVLAERTPGQVPDHRAGGHAQHHRADHLQQRGHEAERVGGVGRGVGRQGLVVAEGAGQALEQRSPGVEGGVGPLAPGDRDDADALAGGGRGQAGDGADVQLGDPGERLDAHPLHRVDVGLLAAVGRDRHGELAGGVPADRAPAAGTAGPGRRRSACPGRGCRAVPRRGGRQEVRGSRGQARPSSRRSGLASGRRAGMILPMGEIVVVTGADGAVGRGVVALALAEPGVERVVAVGQALGDHPAGRRRGGEEVELVAAPFALDDPRLAALVRGATRLVHLGARRGLDLDGTGGAEIDLLGTRALLSMLDPGGCRAVGGPAVVGPRLRRPGGQPRAAHRGCAGPARTRRSRLRSSGPAWRGWSRPGPPSGARPARSCVRASSSGPRTGGGWRGRPGRPRDSRVTGDGAPVQFLHVDDLAAAVGVIGRRGVDGAVERGPRRLAHRRPGEGPEGPGAAAPGPARRSRCASPVGAPGSGWRPATPSTIIAASAPWVVANDRLRSLGWEPTFTNEEAYVDADRGGSVGPPHPPAPPGAGPRRCGRGGAGRHRARRAGWCGGGSGARRERHHGHPLRRRRERRSRRRRRRAGGSGGRRRATTSRWSARRRSPSTTSFSSEPGGRRRPVGQRPA